MQKILLTTDWAHDVQTVIFCVFFFFNISLIYYFLNSKYATVHLRCMFNVPCCDNWWLEPGSPRMISVARRQVMVGIGRPTQTHLSTTLDLSA
jgi:hypothetical protein